MPGDWLSQQRLKVISEGQPQRQLNDAWIRSGRDLAEQAAVRVCAWSKPAVIALIVIDDIRIEEIRVIGDIEKLGAELDIHLFRYRRDLGDCHV